MTYFIIDRPIEEIPKGIYILQYTSSGQSRSKIQNIKTQKTYYVYNDLLKPYHISDPKILDILAILYAS